MHKKVVNQVLAVKLVVSTYALLVVKQRRLDRMDGFDGLASFLRIAGVSKREGFNCSSGVI